jgi:K+-sensing histidine kinase KdpD
VERLEKILKMMTAYVEPKTIRLKVCDLNAIVGRAVRAVTSEFGNEGFGVQFLEDSNLPDMRLDCELIEKVLINLMENAYFRMKEKGEIKVVTGRKDEYARVTLSYSVPFISDDDIEHFFYPFVAEYPFPKEESDTGIVDVPIARIIIHKHGGIIDLRKEDDNVLKITILLPLA